MYKGILIIAIKNKVNINEMIKLTKDCPEIFNHHPRFILPFMNFLNDDKKSLIKKVAKPRGEKRLTKWIIFTDLALWAKLI